MVTARISLIIATRSPTKRPNTHVLATRNIRWGYRDLLYTMVQAFLPNHVEYEYNQCGPLYVYTLTTRLFSGRRGCIRSVYMFFAQAMCLSPLAYASRTRCKLEQTTNDLPCAWNAR
jgi:hypothetical protein